MFLNSIDLHPGITLPLTQNGVEYLPHRSCRFAGEFPDRFPESVDLLPREVEFLSQHVVLNEGDVGAGMHIDVNESAAQFL